MQVLLFINDSKQAQPVSLADPVGVLIRLAGRTELWIECLYSTASHTQSENSCQTEVRKILYYYIDTGK